MSQVVLITGASSGLGKALAEHLQQKGYRVYGTSRRPEKLDLPYPMLALDLADETSIRSAVRSLLEREGRIDVLINNAGIGIAGPLEEAGLDNVRRVFETNFYGAVRTCQAVLPAMREVGRGRILNISTIGAALGLPYRGIYVASKAALDVMTASLRMEVAPFGIELTSILAGDIQTPINDHRIRETPSEKSPYRESFERVYTAIDEDVRHGTPAPEVAKRIEAILRKRRLRRAYRVGKPLQRLSITARAFLPDHLFDRIIMKFSRM